MRSVSWASVAFPFRYLHTLCAPGARHGFCWDSETRAYEVHHWTASQRQPLGLHSSPARNARGVTSALQMTEDPACCPRLMTEHDSYSLIPALRGLADTGCPQRPRPGGLFADWLSAVRVGGQSAGRGLPGGGVPPVRAWRTVTQTCRINPSCPSKNRRFPSR